MCFVCFQSASEKELKLLEKGILNEAFSAKIQL